MNCTLPSDLKICEGFFYDWSHVNPKIPRIQNFEFRRDNFFHHEDPLRPYEYAVGYLKIYGNEVLCFQKKLFRTSKNSVFFQYFIREAILLSYLNHPNILKIYAVGEEDGGAVSLFTEFCSGGDFFKYYMTQLRYLEPEKILDICLPILKKIYSVLKLLHQNNLCHRDLKLENILLRKEMVDGKVILTPVLSDFEYSASTDFLLNNLVGSIDYFPPFLLSAKIPYCGKFVDTWAFGVLLYVILEQNYPFKENQIRQPRKTETKYGIQNLFNSILYHQSPLRIGCSEFEKFFSQIP